MWLVPLAIVNPSKSFELWVISNIAFSSGANYNRCHVTGTEVARQLRLTGARLALAAAGSDTYVMWYKYLLCSGPHEVAETDHGVVSVPSTFFSRH